MWGSCQGAEQVRHEARPQVGERHWKRRPRRLRWMRRRADWIGSKKGRKEDETEKMTVKMP